MTARRRSRRYQYYCHHLPLHRPIADRHPHYHHHRRRHHLRRRRLHYSDDNGDGGVSLASRRRRSIVPLVASWRSPSRPRGASAIWFADSETKPTTK